MSIAAEYKKIDGLVPDPAQLEVVMLLDDLQKAVIEAGKGRPSFLGRLFNGGEAVDPVRGLYLWGGVGRGKTFLMDLFYRSLDLEAKKRYHFHRMMNIVHARLKKLGGIEDPLGVVANSLAEDTRVLCFDEFYVNDIGDAMILGRLLQGLFARGVTLVATSNSPPADLYKDGLQRQRFLPAIDLLEKHTRVLELDGGTDYRLRLLESAGTFIPAGEPNAHDRLCQFFSRIAPGNAEEARVLEILGRSIETVRAAEGVGWFTFEQICGGPRSANDYIELSKLYHTVIVSNVPALDAKRDNEARRFIALVDELYERKVKLILSSDEPVEAIYTGERLAFEYRRTSSRLIEMQSTEYLAAPVAR